MNIDWSKAPEDATHVNRSGIFFKFDENLNARFYSGFRWCGNGCKRGDYDTIGELIERPKKKDAWDGGGDDLPPIGIVCEHAAADNKLDSEEGQWFKVEIIAHHKFNNDEYKCAVWVSGYEISYSSSGSHFRPIKTAEQLEEEEKKKAIDDMQRIYEESMPDYSSRLGHASRPAIKALYEAGYRKQ